MSAGPPDPPADSEVVRSELAGDPDFRPLLQMLVDELPERGRELERLHTAGDWEGLERLAHQLKGAGGGYGFPGLSARAGALEAACAEGRASDAADGVAELTAYLQRIRV